MLDGGPEEGVGLHLRSGVGAACGVSDVLRGTTDTAFLVPWTLEVF